MSETRKVLGRQFDAGIELAWKRVAGLEARVARQAVTVIDPLAARQQLRLRLEIAERLPPLETDAGKLRQVLLNLLANAVNFTDEGKIDLRVGEHG